MVSDVLNTIVVENNCNVDIIKYLFGISKSIESISKNDIDKTYDLIMSYKNIIHRELYLKILKNAIELKQLVS